jgi:release factor glutamine methyltransferase
MLEDASSIADALERATEKLQGISDSARLDAELLLARAIDMPRSFLFAHPDDELDAAALERFEGTLARRLAGEPMAYISGVKEFWSLPLAVSPATLVPRPETELLVEQALMRIPRKAAMRVLDLGTGTGAIALAIASERPLSEVVATDISEAALAVARHNARQLALANVTFLQGDWTAPVSEQRFDIVVSNPPYVEEDDPALHTLHHEPRAALAAGSDGLDAIRRIVAEAKHIIHPGGTLLIEHGATQRDAIATEFELNGWTSVHGIDDLAGKARVSVAEWQE